MDYSSYHYSSVAALKGISVIWHSLTLRTIQHSFVVLFIPINYLANLNWWLHIILCNSKYTTLYLYLCITVDKVFKIRIKKYILPIEGFWILIWMFASKLWTETSVAFIYQALIEIKILVSVVVWAILLLVWQWSHVDRTLGKINSICLLQRKWTTGGCKFVPLFVGLFKNRENGLHHIRDFFFIG